MSISVARLSRAVAFSALLAEASLIPVVVQAQSVREQIREAVATSRNTSFSDFLHQHGKACTVGDSVFSAQLRINRFDGDFWSVRCIEGRTFAIFIGADAKSTSWFMPCTSVERMSNLRCFERAPDNVVFK